MEENNQEEMQDKQQKKSFLNNKKTIKGKALSAWLIAMILIFMLFVFGLGIFLGKELFGKEDNPEAPNTGDETNTEIIDSDEIITLDVNDATVQDLFNKFSYDPTRCFLTGEVLNTSNIARLRVAYDNLDQDAITSVSCSNYKGVVRNTSGGLRGHCGSVMSPEMSNYYAANNEAEFEKAALLNTTKRVSSSDLNNKYAELFSSSYQYSDESFSLGAWLEAECSFMEYYSDSNDYVAYGGQCGGTCAGYTQVINSAYKQGNKLFIETEDDEMKINYEFVLENNSYKFLKVTEIKK